MTHKTFLVGMAAALLAIFTGCGTMPYSDGSNTVAVGYNQTMAKYDDAIRNDPGNAAAWFNRGVAYWYKGNKSQARADWSKALQLDLNNTNARNNLANSY